MCVVWCGVVCMWLGKYGVGTKNGELVQSTHRQLKCMADSHNKSSSIKLSFKTANSRSQHETWSNKFGRTLLIQVIKYTERGG
jgi:hypothetical protein